MRPTLRERLGFWYGPVISPRWVRRTLRTYALAGILLATAAQIGDLYAGQIHAALHGREDWIAWALNVLAPAAAAWLVPSARLVLLGAPVFAGAMLVADFTGWKLKLAPSEAWDEFGWYVPVVVFPTLCAIAVPSALAGALARQLLHPRPLSPARGQCPCGYTLTGLAPGAPCPECGHPDSAASVTSTAQ